jgi:predicted 2-oxoglutarate/Fe(II)-dependent dioxygenase YbiX
MANQTLWYFSGLPEKIIQSVEEDLQIYDNEMHESILSGNVVDRKIRNSKNTWIPTSHWIAGLAWHYVERANRENFLYDIEHIDAESMQYTRYCEGEYYNWHTDADISSSYKPESKEGKTWESHENYLNKKCEKIRKLSFIIQLSNPEDYEGGNVQFMSLMGNKKSYFLPRERGTIAIFDSRAEHRVHKIKSGMRKSIVGWVVGPRWR